MPESEGKENKTWNQSQFVEKIIKAVGGHDIPESELPQVVDLTGRIGEISDDLMKSTLADPQKRERARVGIVGLDAKLRMDKEDTVGEERQVNAEYIFKVRRNRLGPQYNKREYPALLIHTHGIADRPPSGPDLAPLFKDTEDGGIHSSIVITSSMKFLLIKTLQTPARNSDEVNKVVEKHFQDYKDQIRAEMVAFERHMNKFGGATEESSVRHIAKKDPIIQINLLNEVCRENHIAMYTAINDNVYRRVKR